MLMSMRMRNADAFRLACVRSARDAADTAEKKGRREERDAKRNGTTTRRKPVELDEDDAFDAVRLLRSTAWRCHALTPSSPCRSSARRLRLSPRRRPTRP